VLLHEMTRVGRENARLYLRCPHGSNDRAWMLSGAGILMFEGFAARLMAEAVATFQSCDRRKWVVTRETLVLSKYAVATDDAHLTFAIKTQRNMVDEIIVEGQLRSDSGTALSDPRDGTIYWTRDPRVFPNFGSS
jgi:hypothetical protein